MTKKVPSLEVQAKYQLLAEEVLNEEQMVEYNEIKYVTEMEEGAAQTGDAAIQG